MCFNDCLMSVKCLEEENLYRPWWHLRTEWVSSESSGHTTQAFLKGILWIFLQQVQTRSPSIQCQLDILVLVQFHCANVYSIAKTMNNGADQSESRKCMPRVLFFLWSDGLFFPFVISHYRHTYLKIPQASSSLCIDMLTVVIQMSSTEL